MERTATSRPSGGLLRRAGALLTLVSVLALAPSGAAAPPSVRVQDVKLTAPSADMAKVIVTATGEIHFSARVADGGSRLIVDIDGASVAGAPSAITTGNSVVAGVMTQAFTLGSQKTTRVLVQLARHAEYRVRVEDGGVTIDLVAAEKTAPMSDAAPRLRPAQGAGSTSG